MQKERLTIKNYVNGINDSFFYDSDNPIVIREYTCTKPRMGVVPTMNATLLFDVCLDNYWNGTQYVVFQNEKYYIFKTPSSSKDNTDARYKHEIQFFSERNILNGVYFFDVASANNGNDGYVSNSSNFSFYGNIHQLCAKLNASAQESDIGYSFVVDSGISSDNVLIQFSDVYLANALTQSFDSFQIPFYFDGKVCHFGYTSNAITQKFEYGKDNELLSISKTNANYQIVRSCTGVGSGDNLPHYYPNTSEGDSRFIRSNVLMPKIFRDTLGSNRFYKALDNTYTNSDTGEYYTFDNLYNDKNQGQFKVTFEDIKPTMVGIKNAANQYIDEFVEFAYDSDDNDEVDSNGEYIHSYFYAKLRKFDGANGFNIFDSSIAKAGMSVVFQSGKIAPSEFEIGVVESTDSEGKQIFLNPVQVDSTGAIVAGSYADKVKPNEIQERQQNTQTNSVWIALKKNENTYGVVMPNVSNNYRPSANDKFLFLNIGLPQAYILAAEQKLEDNIIKYLVDNNSEKFNFTIKFSSIYLAQNQSVFEQINDNARLLIRYNNTDYTFYVNNYTYKAENNNPLPSIEVQLTDTLTVHKNVLESSISNIKNEIMSSVGSVDFLKQGLKYFIRKDVDDSAYGSINFLKGIFFGQYVSGTTGGAITVDKDGKTFAEIDYLKVRLKAIFEILEIAHVQSIMGKFIITSGGSQKIIKVEKKDTYYRCYFLAEQDGVKVENTFVVDDLLMSKGFNLKPIAPESDDKFLGDFNDDYSDDFLKQRENTSGGGGNRYFWRKVVGVGDDYVDLSIADCDTLSDAPIEGDTMCHVGNTSDITRQNAIIISAVDNFSPSITLYQGINSYSFLDKEFVNIGVDKTTNKAFLNVYGSMYFGNRDLSSYIKYDEVSGVEIKGRLVTRSGQDVENVLTNYQDLIDGVKEIFYGEYIPTLENYPAVEWDSEGEKVRHEGDVFTNLTQYIDDETTPNAGSSWKWVNNNDVYSWELITDEDATKVYYEGAIGKRDAVNAKDAATALNNEIRILRQTTNEAFEDGTISSDDAALINSQITQLNIKRDIVTSTYNAVLTNVLLDDLLQNKANLTTGYNSLINALNELVGLIQSYTADGTITQEEKSAINIKYDLLDVKYNDYIGYLNAANNYIQNKVKKINLMTLSEDIQSYEYIKDAIEKNTTTIDGGLILSSLLMLGYNDENDIFRVMSGINGVYDNPKTISAWYGGDMVDMFDYYNYTENKFENLPASYAKGVDRMDGTGYRANGNLWWDADGKVHADPLSFFVGEETVGILLAAFYIEYDDATGVQEYIRPNIPFSHGKFLDYVQVGSIKITYDATSNALKIIKEDGTDANLYTTGGLSALGQSTTTGGGGSGGGLITSVYGYTDLGNTFYDSTKNDTFNAYTIAELAKKIDNLETSPTTSLTWSAIENKPTTLSGYGITDAAVSSHTHNYVPLEGTSYIKGSLVPSINNTFLLGTSSSRWTNIYAVDGNFIGYITQNGVQVSLEGHTHTGYLTTLTSAMISNALGYAPYNGANLNKATIEGLLTGNITSHTHNYMPLSGSSSISGSMNPITHNAYTLGTDSLRWSNINSVSNNYQYSKFNGLSAALTLGANSWIRVFKSNAKLSYGRLYFEKSSGSQSDSTLTIDFNFGGSGAPALSCDTEENTIFKSVRIVKESSTSNNYFIDIKTDGISTSETYKVSGIFNEGTLQTPTNVTSASVYELTKSINLVIGKAISGSLFVGDNVTIGNSGETKILTVNGNILSTVGLSTYSDIRLKSDIQPLKNRGYIQPCTYIKDGKKDIGFIAQDVQELYPELVYEGEYLSLNYQQITAVLEAQIIELRKEINNLNLKLNNYGI